MFLFRVYMTEVIKKYSKIQKTYGNIFMNHSIREFGQGGVFYSEYIMMPYLFVGFANRLTRLGSPSVTALFQCPPIDYVKCLQLDISDVH